MKVQAILMNILLVMTWTIPIYLWGWYGALGILILMAYSGLLIILAAQEFLGIVPSGTQYFVAIVTGFTCLIGGQNRAWWIVNAKKTPHNAVSRSS